MKKFVSRLIGAIPVSEQTLTVLMYRKTVVTRNLFPKRTPEIFTCAFTPRDVVMMYFTSLPAFCEQACSQTLGDVELRRSLEVRHQVNTFVSLSVESSCFVGYPALQ